MDAQLSPAIAAWINRSFEHIEAVSVRSVAPQLIWITCGNTSNAKVLSTTPDQVHELIVEGETVVEVSDKPKL